ncbi:MAG: helix-turn-helix transcriptional regulator [Bacteroidia bacterium]
MQLVTAEINLKSIPLNKNESSPIHIKASVIHILFSHDSTVLFEMGRGRTLPLPPHSSYLFYEQHGDFEFPIVSEKSSQLTVLELPIEVLHGLVSKGVDELNFNSTDIFNQDRYHKLSSNTEEINQCLSIIVGTNNPILLESKKFELLNYYFTVQDKLQYKCPFLNQKDNVEKVRKAKELLLKDLQNSPTIKELSKMVGLNESNLKTGFKEIYAKPIHSFLKDHKMNEAQSLIDERNYKINEIAEQMGYSNVSHFIEAFKKKFGVTPKQYELRTENR